MKRAKCKDQDGDGASWAKKTMCKRAECKRRITMQA